MLSMGRLSLIPDTAGAYSRRWWLHLVGVMRDAIGVDLYSEGGTLLLPEAEPLAREQFNLQVHRGHVGVGLRHGRQIRSGF